jgi:hypothetical protein
MALRLVVQVSCQSRVRYARRQWRIDWRRLHAFLFVMVGSTGRLATNKLEPKQV